MSTETHVDVAGLVALARAARGFTFLPNQPVRSLLTGRHGSRLRGRGLNFDEIRHYLPGDDIRSIDWKVTARTRMPHSRVYTEERDRPVLLVVDQRQAMFFGSRRSLKSVTAAEAAALAAWRVLAVRDRIGALIFNDEELIEIRPQRSRSTVMQILGNIAKLNQRLRAGAPEPRNPGMLDESLRHAERAVKHDGLIIIISDADGATMETGKIVGRIGRHNDVLFGLVFDPLEADLPGPRGRLTFVEGNRQLEVDTDSGRLRRGFARAFNERASTIKAFLQHREIPILMLSTAEDAAVQIRRELGARQGSHA